MVEPIHLSPSAVVAEPHLPWNAFVDIVALSTYEHLTPVQRLAHLAFWYESEIQNGGHLQYFENQGTSRVDEVTCALEAIGAPQHAAVLRRAASQCMARMRGPIGSIEEFVAVALEAEFREADNAFHQCQPSLQQVLEQYLQQNLAAFVEIA